MNVIVHVIRLDLYAVKRAGAKQINLSTRND